MSQQRLQSSAIKIKLTKLTFVSWVGFEPTTDRGGGGGGGGNEKGLAGKPGKHEGKVAAKRGGGIRGRAGATT